MTDHITTLMRTMHEYITMKYGAELSSLPTYEDGLKYLKQPKVISDIFCFIFSSNEYTDLLAENPSRALDIEFDVVISDAVEEFLPFDE